MPTEKYAQKISFQLPWWKRLLAVVPYFRRKFMVGTIITSASVSVNYRMKYVNKFKIYREKRGITKQEQEDPKFIEKHCRYIGDAGSIIMPGEQYWLVIDTKTLTT